MIKTNLGGDRLGSGGKLVTELEGYSRSTHNLSKTVRTTATTGTLMPVFTEFAQKGDIIELDIESLIRTHPTNGPVFGSYKVQVDVFTADVRLYNKLLHNNMTKLGLNMQKVIFPQMRIGGQNPCLAFGDLNHQQVAPDSLLAYLGVRGLGTKEELWDGNESTRDIILRSFNGIPLLMYWDIYKEYYANKQEEIGYVIAPNFKTDRPVIDYFTVKSPDTPLRRYEANMTAREDVNIKRGDTVKIYGTFLSRNTIYLAGTGPQAYVDNRGWDVIHYDETGRTLEFIGFQKDGELWQANEQVGFGWSILLPAIDKQITVSDGIELEEFELEAIDDVRKKIFAQEEGIPLVIGWSDNHTITGMPYKATTGITSPGDGGIATIRSEAYSKFTMSGLGIKTYQSDRFNNWLNKTWIETINNISSITIENGQFSMNSFILAEKVFKMENRIATAGGTYQDWLSTVYGEETHGANEMPVYRGGYQAMMVFDEVVSSSDATTQGGEDQPLGTLGGRGAEKMRKGGRVSIKMNEHGFVMIILSLTPHIDYYQGNKWWTFGLATMDDIHKPQLDSIGYQDLITEEMAAWDTKYENDITPVTQFSAGKQTSWVHYQTNQNEVYGNFARENNEEFMVLTRRYNPDENGRIEDLTTYIDPTKFNYPFAYGGLDNQPFWVQIGIDAKFRRIMAATQMPNL